MIRTLLAGTAIATLISTGATAQSSDRPADQTTQPSAAADSIFYTPDEDSRLASTLLGKSVHASAAPDAERIGEINDVIVDPDGDTGAVVIGVGGFLGIGEKEVAVSVEQVQWEMRDDGEDWLILDTSRAALEAAPAFDRTAFDGGRQGDAYGVQPEDSPAAMAANQAQAEDGIVPREQMTAVPVDEISAEELVGTTVYGADDTTVGDISDVILSADGQIDAIVIDVGGFLGLGQKPIAVGFENLEFFTDENGTRYLYTSFTQEQLEAQPAYDPETYSEDRERQRLVQ